MVKSFIRLMDDSIKYQEKDPFVITIGEGITRFHRNNRTFFMVKLVIRLMENVLYMVLYRTFLKRVPYSTKKGSATVMMSSL